MVLMHTAGCPATPVQADIMITDAVDWGKIIRCLEDMAPSWEPGTRVLYAPYTFGYIIGEVVRRITGKTIGTVFQEEIAGPLDLNLWIGLPADKEDKVVPTMSKEPLKHPADDPRIQVDSLPPLDLSDPPAAAYLSSFSNSDTPQFMNSREAHAAEIPASSGIGDARSLAKFYAHLIGEVDGRPALFTKHTLQAATTTLTDGIPPAGVFGERHAEGYFRFARGYEKKNLLGQPMLGESSFGHVGYGAG
ncbi:beta-lactamase/transpeptidase-like protein [Calocera cornea HHB12733]|uniref:Beta-lactamase/transpeptidase-like protein n=1 Tax=Calocera cornea HHB12733 TaxID=1353952 RepID=A0A165HNF1_9BASI|nr:beta-lactamase/transpeptidase-like protein [Calocera cornea HHB12733]